MLGKHPPSFLLLPSETTELLFLLLLPPPNTFPAGPSLGSKALFPWRNQSPLPLSQRSKARGTQNPCLYLEV